VITVSDRFDTLTDRGIDDTAAAILCLAEAIHSLADGRLSHELCLGIRHGLFGTDADASSTIETLATEQ